MSDNQVKFVQTIEVNDNVMAGSIDISSDNIAVTWQPSVVSFSDGTSPGGPTQMIVIQYGAAGEIIATTDQLLLLSNGKLKAANRLTPLDQLVGQDGNPIQIESIRLVEYTGGIHHIGLGRVLEPGVAWPALLLILWGDSPDGCGNRGSIIGQVLRRDGHSRAVLDESFAAPA